MKREAILIESSNIQGQKDLPGARDDMKSWITFLSSEIGGAWENSEISLLKKPQESDVKKLLAFHQDKYCLVVFSGHGYYDAKDKITKVCLREKELDVPITSLTPKGPKGTLIVDACRGVENAINFSAVNESVQVRSMRMDSIEFSEPIIKTASNTSALFWHTKLNSSSNGIVTMYSCSKGQSAGEFDEGDPLKGGYFTTSMMIAARNWHQFANKNAFQNTLEAFNSASSIMKRFDPVQKPEYSPTYISFPFAVKT